MKYRIRRVAGYMVIDKDGNQVSPDFLSKEECEDWIEEAMER